MSTSAAVAYTEQQKKALLDDFDLEAAERRRLIERHIHDGLLKLKRRLERELARLAASTAVLATSTSSGSTSITAAEYLLKCGNASFGSERLLQTGAREAAPRLAAAARDEEDNEDIERTIKKSIKKRKRHQQQQQQQAAAARGGDDTTEDDSTQHSPTKPRKNQRMAPPTPTQPGSSRFPTAASARASARHRVPSATGSRADASASSANHPAGSSTSNFVYRARPSLASFNPRLPQTPQIRAGATFGNGNGKGTERTARRQPKRNESIQAYSMNGSPLGILDLAVESDAAPAPQDVPSSSAVHTSDGEWEVLQPRSGLSTTANTNSRHATSANYGASSVSSAANGSPEKRSLLRKGSASALGNGMSSMAGASSSFKAAIISGASRVVKPKSSAASLASNAAAAASERERDFTFRPPSGPGSVGYSPTKSKIDWIKWVDGFKRELEGMDMLPEDKKRLEARMLEMMR